MENKAEKLKGLMETEVIGRSVVYYDEIDSTNNEAKRLALAGAPHGTLVTADIQNAGKGRLGRSWSSPPGMGIWMSLILRPKLEPEDASMLTLLAAVAVSDGIMNLGIRCQIKWPNDIVVNGKKVCGILTEMSTRMDQINYVVVGIGINVHNQSFPEEIAAVAASLDQVKDKARGAGQIHRGSLIADVMKYFEKYYDTFMKEKNLAFILPEYNRRLVNIHQQVAILENGTKRLGISGGIDDRGCLVAVIDGKEEHILSGEVSVRGVLGYV